MSGSGHGGNSMDEQVHRELSIDDTDITANADLAEMAATPGHLFEQAMEQTRMAICITDPNQDDGPIIFVNQAFCEMTGYEREEIIGRNCRFLQGEDTDPRTVQRIRDALTSEEVTVVEILNYRKDGTPFWNALHVGPIYEDGKLAQFYGSQWDITETVEKRERMAREEQISIELRHRTANLFTVILSILRLSARDAADKDALVKTVEERIIALGKAHHVTIREGGASEEADLRALIGTILDPYAMDGDGGRGVRERVEVADASPRTALPRVTVTPVGLSLHELATNAVKHGALSVPEGRVVIDWQVEDAALTLRWRERGGPSAERTKRAGGTGGRIIDTVMRSVNGTVERTAGPDGMAVDIVVPISPD